MTAVDVWDGDDWATQLGSDAVPDHSVPWGSAVDYLHDDGVTSGILAEAYTAGDRRYAIVQTGDEEFVAVHRRGDGQWRY